MATKAARFRYESERSAPKRAAKKAGASTAAQIRKVEAHVKAVSSMTVRETMERRSPSERAQRGRMPSRGKAPAR